MTGDVLACPFCGEIPELVFDQEQGVEMANCHHCMIRVTPLVWNHRHFPEGCTPTDARHLRDINHDLADDNERLEGLLLKAWRIIGETGHVHRDPTLQAAVHSIFNGDRDESDQLGS